MLTLVGALLTVALLVAGVLLTVGSSFATSSVHDQLAQQHISFPTKMQCQHPVPNSEVTPSMVNTVCKYAGQELLTGQEANVFANDYISVHLQEIGGGLTYSQLSAKSMAEPSNAALAAQVETMFKGTTLRGLLLEAYAFSIFGTIATIAMIASWILFALMLVLTLLGFRHYRRTPPDVAFLEPKSAEAMA
jgi:hypothetical protein